MTDLVVRGGTVVTPEGVNRADVAIEGEVISAIAPELPGAAEEVDARGLFILPGLIAAQLDSVYGECSRV